MDKKKKKHRFPSRVPLTKKKSHQDDMFDVENVKIVTLHPNTQKIIGCQIGIDINPENPWIYVAKSKIEDHIFLHDKSSEFLSIKEDIENYPEEEMFVGSIEDNMNVPVDFGICVTLDAVLNIKQKMTVSQFKVMVKVRNSLNLYSRPWYSYGSEPEVESDMILNNRKLFSVVLKSNFPITTEKIRFTLDLASPKTKRYVELLPGRHHYVNILRRRIDKKIQASPIVIDKSIQTTLPYPVNKQVQYEYSITAKYMNDQEYKRLSESCRNLIKMIENALIVNYYIHLHEDEYFIEDLFRGYSEYSPRDILQMQDVTSCLNTKVTSVSWNPMISGMIAAAYATTPPLNFIIQKESKYKELTDNFFDDNLVFLWRYSNNLFPTLYFHAPREVTFISFCPYNQNILVGGCCNGQVIVWDMEKNFNSLDTREVLTAQQVNHRMYLQNFMDWFKPPPHEKNVFPTLISEIDTSHRSPVTHIQWLPSKVFMTKNGKFVLPEPGTEKYQFLTCSLEDSYVLTWNIKYHEDNLTFIPPKTKKRLQRLDKIPETLTTDKSKLRNLNLTFRPSYRLRLYNRQDHSGIFATKMLLRNQNIVYEPIKRGTVNKYFRRTYHSAFINPEGDNLSQNFILTTATGYITNNSWTGYDFDQGQKINEELCTTIAFTNYHDGPLINCVENPYFNTVYLVVGGRVFSIWDISIPYPILWRKSKCQYVSAVWYPIHPFSLLTIRTDQILEIWNLGENSLKPIRIFKCNGNTVVNLFNENRILEPSNQTFIICDQNGAIRVSQMQQKRCFESEHFEINEAVTLLKHFKRRKAILLDVQKKLAEKTKKIMEEMEALESPKLFGAGLQDEQKMFLEKSLNEFIKKSSITEKEVFQKKEFFTHKNDWQERQEMIMYKILLDQKKLNLAEIEKNKGPLMKLLSEYKQRERRIKRLIAHKNVIFENEQIDLLKQSRIRTRRKITVDFSPEFKNLLKKRYIKNYEKTEEKSLIFIKTTPFRYVFEWSHILNEKTETNKLELDKSRPNILSGKKARLRRMKNAFPMEQEQTCSFEIQTITDDVTFSTEEEITLAQRRKSKVNHFNRNNS